MEQPSRPETAESGMQEIQARLRQLERQDWWLWLTAILVMLLLALAVLSFSLPALFERADFLFQFRLRQGARGLLALVLLFCIYTVYQQILVKRLRSQQAGQIAASSRLQVQAEESRRLALLDPLTGFCNRRFLEQHLATELPRAQRHGYPLTALMLDLNKFKQINDQYGHAAGDLALTEFTERLKKCTRSSDVLVRAGGDEFLALLPECSPGQVPHMLARLTGLEVEFDGEKFPVTFAAGWTTYQPGESPAQFLERADQALYADKRTGKAEEAIREAQAAARQIQKMEAVGRLAGGIAHDFNNLLTLVKGYSELTLDRLAQGDPLRRYVEQIHQASERASALTRQLLAFSRKQPLALEIVDLNVLIAVMEAMLRPLIGEHIRIVLVPGPSLGPVQADRGQLEQVILNLAVNARDAMPQGGKLTLATVNVELDEVYVRNHPGARPGSYVMLAVSDTGHGMNAETLAHTFEPFFTTKEIGKGTGLGLATVYGIVKQSGGYIWVDSEPGQGTIFTIYLPRAEKVEKKVEAVEPAKSTLAVAQEAETILVVEDVEGVRKLTREFLEGSGYRVLEASKGPEALQIAEQHPGPIHLLLTDVVMPEMNGKELAERLVSRRPEIKVVYMSGHMDDTLVRHSLSNPEEGFLQKPFSRETLTHKLREMLGAAVKQ